MRKKDVLKKTKVFWIVVLLISATFTILLTETTTAVFTNIAKDAPITGQCIGSDLENVNDGNRNTYAYTGTGN